MSHNLSSFLHFFFIDYPFNCILLFAFSIVFLLPSAILSEQICDPFLCRHIPVENAVID